MAEQDGSRTPSISISGLKHITCCISIAVPLTHPHIPHKNLFIHQLCSGGLLGRRRIAATWGREGVKGQTVVKRPCRELSPALGRGNREEAQVEAQGDQAAKGWSGLCSTPEASMQNSLFSTSWLCYYSLTVMGWQDLTKGAGTFLKPNNTWR